MGASFVLKVSWILITLLPLTFAVRVDGRHQKNTSVSSEIATQEENSNNPHNYEMDYHEYLPELFLNETHNDTNDFDDYYYSDNYSDYYGYFSYREFEDYDGKDGNNTEIISTTIKPTKMPEKGIKRPKVKKLQRKARNLPEDKFMKHLCMINLLNVTDIFNYVPHFYECPDKQLKHFACLNSNGFIKPCQSLKGENSQMSLCIKKKNPSYVITCNLSQPKSFCFTGSEELNRIEKCNDQKHRVCFNGSLTKCENQKKRILPSTRQPKYRNQERKRVPRTVGRSHKHKNQKPRIVNCKKCKVDVVMVVDETVDDPVILVKVSKLNSSEKNNIENSVSDANQ